MRRATALDVLLTVGLVGATAAPCVAAKRELSTNHRFPAADAKRITIDVTDLDVTMRAADVPEIELSTELRISKVGAGTAESWIAAHTPVVTDHPEQLTVQTPEAKPGFLGIGHLTAHGRLQALAPATVVPDVTTTTGSIDLSGDFPLAAPLRMRTSEGSVSFRGATGWLDLRSASGSVRLELIRALDRLTARTSSGGVTLLGGARAVEVDTASGAVELDNLSGSAVVETATGRVALAWDRLDAHHTVVVRSTSGKVELILPAGCRPRGTVVTTTGTIRCDLPGTSSEGGSRIELSGDGPSLEVETASSTITLTARSSGSR